MVEIPQMHEAALQQSAGWTEQPAQTPPLATPSDGNPEPIGRRIDNVAIDTLSDVLRTVRLTGAAFFDVACSPPWAEASPRQSHTIAATA